MKQEEIKGLIRQIAEGDERAFEQFFNVFYPRFYRYAFLYLKSDIICEELVSDVFLKLWNSRNKLVDVEHIEFYLFKAVKNQVLTYLKKQSIPFEHLTNYKITNLVEYNEPENLIINRELAQQIEKMIAQLPAKCQTIFRMVREDGLSYKEVAQLLGISKKTVDNQMVTALKRLREALQSYYRDDKLRNKTFYTLLF